MCVKGGSGFVVAETDFRLVYRLDKTRQEKTRDFDGQKVKSNGACQRQDNPPDGYRTYELEVRPFHSRS